MADFYYVPVRPKDMDQVTALIAALNRPNTRGSGDEPLTITPVPVAPMLEAVQIPNEGLWSRADLEAVYRLAYPPHIAILTRIAEAGLEDKAATFNDLVEAVRGSVTADYAAGNLRGDLSWIAKYAKKVKGGEHVRPMTITKPIRPEELPEGNRYWMPKQIASWWIEIVGD